MFCPKCGTQNPDNGKFCRSCGTNLAPVSEALSGKLTSKNQGSGMIDPIPPAQMFGGNNEPNTWENALVKLFMGLAFLIVSIVLAFTHMGRNWWFWMLIPAFGLLGSGLAQCIQLKKNEQKPNPQIEPETSKSFSVSATNPSLPPTQNDYIAPAVESRYKTGDLVPPSVTEGTTRHLEVNQEGETMTLPKTKQ
jgi:hypothetical protein